jgi:hypothetical protein
MNRVTVFDIRTRKSWDKSDPLNQGRVAIVRMQVNGLPFRMEGMGENNDEAMRDMLVNVASLLDKDFLRIAELAAPVAVAHPNIVEQTGDIVHDDQT